MQNLDANSKIKTQKRQTSSSRKSFERPEVMIRSKSVTAPVRQSNKSVIQDAATEPAGEPSIKTGLRKPSPFTSIPRGRGKSFTSPSLKSKTVLPRLSRPATAGGDTTSSRPTGKRKPSDGSIGHDGATLPLADVDVPQMPPRPWQANYSTAEVRSSFKSALTAASSRVDASSTERSSVFTKGTSIGDDSTIDLISRPASKAGSMTVDDAIDMYAEGFADDNELELGESRDTSMSEEEQRRSMRIAEAINDTMGEMNTSLCPTVEEPGSAYAIISGDAFRNPPSLPPPITSPTSTHDQYGFLKCSQHVSAEQYESWFRYYWPSQERRQKKWASYMRDYALPTHSPTRFPKRSEKTERFVRKGIPPVWRGSAWFYYAGGQAYLARHPRLYTSLLKRSESEVSLADQEAIERDLHRTFPDNIHFKPGKTYSAEIPILTSLRRVLRAFALHSPRIGYCQSLNFIAGLLLLFLPEEKAFWMLHIIATVYLPGTHEVSLEGANIDLWVLMVALKSTMPTIWGKVCAAGTPGDELVGNARLPPISLCTTSWFMSLFIGTLPIESVLRVWDCLFYEGSRVLFRVALTIFRLGEQRINEVNDSMELFQVVQALPKDLLDAGSLIKTLCKRGGVGSDWVELRRWERKEWYAREKARATFLNDDPEANDYFGQKSDEPKIKRRESLWRRKLKGSAPSIQKAEGVPIGIPKPASAVSLA